jgi:hypothetical protein
MSNQALQVRVIPGPSALEIWGCRIVAALGTASCREWLDTPCLPLQCTAVCRSLGSLASQPHGLADAVPDNREQTPTNSCAVPIHTQAAPVATSFTRAARPPSLSLQTPAIARQQGNMHAWRPGTEAAPRTAGHALAS